MTNDEGCSNDEKRFQLRHSFVIGHSSFFVRLSILRIRLTNSSSLPPAGTCPSSNYHARVCARGLCGSPSRQRLRLPIRSLPDRRWLLPHPVRDYKNQSRPARRRESQTRPCSSRNQETG